MLHVTSRSVADRRHVVRVGDRVYDGSIRTQLEHARRAMIERATEQIETRPERFMSTA